MKKLFYLLVFVTLTQACGEKKESGNESSTALFLQPKKFPINLDEGYPTNTHNGDSVECLINLNGDTVKTGTFIKAIGIEVNTDTMPAPNLFELGNVVIKDAHENQSFVAENLEKTEIHSAEIIKSKLGEGDPTFFSLDSEGDTIITGEPIIAHPDTVHIKLSPPIRSLPGRMRDGAISNLTFYDVEQGLKSSYITSLLQDSRGNIWLGSWVGLTRFDGSNFTHFGINEGFTDKKVGSLFEDSNGKIWIGTFGDGIYKYDGQNFVVYNHENSGLASNTHNVIIEDKSGAIWTCDEGSGLMRIKSDTVINLSKKEGLSSQRITRIYYDSQDQIWMGTWGGGVMVFENGTITTYKTENGLSSNIVTSFLEDEHRNIWITTYGGLDKFDGSHFTHIKTEGGEKWQQILSDIWFSYKDKSGNLWFGGGSGTGLTKLTISKNDTAQMPYFTNYSHQNEACDYLQSIIEDEEGNIWYGTNGGGAGKLIHQNGLNYSGEGFTFYSEKNGLSNNYIWSITEDPSGNVWFSSDGGTIIKYDGINFSNFYIYNYSTRPAIKNIVHNQDGTKWISGDGNGLTKIENNKATQYTIYQGLRSDFVSCLHEDKNGVLWIGSNRGISSFDGKKFVNYSETEGLSSQVISSMTEAKNGDLWFGTLGGGVIKYDGESFFCYTEKEGLCNNFINCVHQDNQANFWFGTMDAGLIKFDGEIFTNYTEKEGLVNNGVTSILSDTLGNLWIGTDAGLSLMILENTSDKNDRGQTQDTSYRIINYTASDGLKGQDLLPQSAFIDSKNRAWWGSGKCLVSCNLNNFVQPNNAPEIYLRTVEINERFIDFRNYDSTFFSDISFSGVSPFENYPINLILPYSKNHLTFHFSAIDWKAPRQLKYSYQLSGVSDEWSDPTTELKADYRNLSPGSYTFKVKAIGIAQKWSETFEYQFTILPPWWSTWWFRGLMILAVGLILFLIYRWRTVALRARQKQLEKTVEERTEDLKKEKELVEEKHKEITDSINYAERIQRSFLATKTLLDENLKEYFVFFQPKDVVSGDFYWATKLQNNQFALVTADSTGHGVPGAIMSIANIACLKESVTKGLVKPNEILNETRKLVIDYLKNDGSVDGGKDGMDASLVCFDFANKKLNYAAANNPVWIVRPSTGSGLGEIIECAPDKMPVGKHDKQYIPFSSNHVELKSGDVVYTLTDGLPDQFGGVKGKKFMYKKLKELLISIASDPMELQKEKLNKAFFDWKGDLEQVDDVCVIGVRV